MVFLKRLWEELWVKEETPNIIYDVPMVHSCKRDIFFDIQILLLEVFGSNAGHRKFRYQELAELRQQTLLRLVEADILTVNEARAEQAGEPIIDSEIKTSEQARKCLEETLKEQESDFDREVC